MDEPKKEIEKFIQDIDNSIQKDMYSEKKIEEKLKPVEILSFLRDKIEEIGSDLRYNQDGKNNGDIGLKLGRMYQAILFELDKKK